MSTTVRIDLDGLHSDRLWCRIHNVKVIYEPVDEATSPIDTSNSTCPGLDRQIKNDPRLNEDKEEFSRAELDDAMNACTASWQLELEVEARHINISSGLDDE